MRAMLALGVGIASDFYLMSAGRCDTRHERSVDGERVELGTEKFLHPSEARLFLEELLGDEFTVVRVPRRSTQGLDGTAALGTLAMEGDDADITNQRPY